VRRLYMEGIVRQIWLRGDERGACRRHCSDSLPEGGSKLIRGASPRPTDQSA
jgi:hypothetical protein